jgi:hypothetical protein
MGPSTGYVFSLGIGTGIPMGARGPSRTPLRTDFKPERMGVLSDGFPGFLMDTGSCKDSLCFFNYYLVTLYKKYTTIMRAHKRVLKRQHTRRQEHTKGEGL